MLLGAHGQRMVMLTGPPEWARPRSCSKLRPTGCVRGATRVACATPPLEHLVFRLLPLLETLGIYRDPTEFFVLGPDGLDSCD